MAARHMHGAAIRYDQAVTVKDGYKYSTSFEKRM
jgi:hypothetical protein